MWRKETTMRQRIRIAAAAAALLAIGPFARQAFAQHEGHGAAAKPTAVSGAHGDCAARAKESLHVLDAASRRIEEARQTNNPGKMRAAVEELQRDLAQIRARMAASIPPPATPPAPGGRVP
jgi:hypothetical protein